MDGCIQSLSITIRDMNRGVKKYFILLILSSKRKCVDALNTNKRIFTAKLALEHKHLIYTFQSKREKTNLHINK
jgi:hypothetical protein